MTLHPLRFALSFVVALAFVGISGCAVLQPFNDALAYKQGTRITDEQLAEFKKGSTTRQQIIDAVGGPQEIKNVGTKEHLIYTYSQVNHFGPNEGRTVTFVLAKGLLAEKLVSKNNPVSNPFTSSAAGGQ